MASRQEQKEARRQERLERERKEAAAAARRKRLQLGAGVLLGLAAIAGVVIAIVVGLGGDDSGPEEPTSGANAAAKLPAQQTSDYEEAAKAAGCTLENPQFEGASHESKDFTPADYKTNPPTSGNHEPEWYEDGVYVPGTTPQLGMLVHTLEHGRINIQYKKGTAASTVAKLEALVAEQNEGYHLLLYENTTGMKPAIAATAWTHSLSCPSMNDKAFDAIRTFRSRYTDKGPETVP
ncbi:MAG TPA: DUF3105 domain-containing protein [Solirubrobacteraceae bacterium]|nr:DUF3105 domain-containing protein [Solirubrobacteraceae bacterium]